MSHLTRFALYAAAFEESYKSDDWSAVEPFFTEDAVYEVRFGPPIGGLFEGRDAILAAFQRILDGFDRRFESRELELLEGPREVEGGGVWLRGRAIYRAEGVPDFALELEETAWFEGDCIRRLEDDFTDAMRREGRAYLEAHGATLGLDLGD